MHPHNNPCNSVLLCAIGQHAAADRAGQWLQPTTPPLLHALVVMAGAFALVVADCVNAPCDGHLQVLSYQGQQYHGRAAIISRLQQAVQELGPGATWHINKVDSQALGSGDRTVRTGCIIAHIRGRLEVGSTVGAAVGGSGGAMSRSCGLAASFIFGHLLDGCWYVANQMVRVGL